MKPLPPHLVKLHSEIKGYAEGYGLDAFETIFEVLDYSEINEVASYMGFPTRYPHWSFGMEYERMSKSYTYGLSKIYEMVINNDPCYAYLLECNNLVDQKIVMAHVYGHCDFFKNNYWFSKTNRKMMDEIANHATRIRSYMEKFGVDMVENFIDVCLSIDNLIDYHSPFIVRKKQEKIEDKRTVMDIDARIKKIQAKDYMDSYINPKDFIDYQKMVIEEKETKQRNFPQEPEKDIMNFLMDYAPLEWWQRDVLSIIREEAYYFSPQGQTKIMNEGWASFWHSTIMTQKAMTADEVVDFADHHSGTVAMNQGSLNPYKIGLELFRDIEDRWNKGQFGKEWEECDDYREKQNWDKKLGLGREKIFEVRKHYNDITFLDSFLTLEFCNKHRLFTYSFNKRTNNYEISSRDFEKIKKTLLFQLTNFGQPIIYVKDGNFENRSELLLWHKHEGLDLQLNYAKEVMTNIYKIWTRPVSLETVLNKKKVLLSFNGKEHTERNLE